MLAVCLEKQSKMARRVRNRDVTPPFIFSSKFWLAIGRFHVFHISLNQVVRILTAHWNILIFCFSHLKYRIYYTILILKIPQGNNVYLVIFEIKRDLLKDIYLLVFTEEKRRLHTERIHGDNLLFHVLLTPLSI